MKSTPKPKDSAAAELIKMFQRPQLTDEQKAEIAKQKERYHNAVNMAYKTECGELVIKTFMQYCRYWDSLFRFDEKDRDAIQFQQEMVRTLIMRELTDENLADLLSKTRKGN